VRYQEIVVVDAAPQSESESESESERALRDKVAILEAALAATKSELSAVTAERNKLRRAYEMVKGELELLRRRLFIAKAERIDTTQLEIEFAETKSKLDQLARALDEEGGVGGEANANATTDGGGSGGDGRPAGRKKTSKGSGRPDLTKLDLIEERVEILDPALEGTAERIGFETTYLLGRRRACTVRVVMAKATYKTTTVDENGEETVEYTTAPKPREIVDRGMLAPSFIAFLLTKKYRWGMPFHRVALELLAEGVSVDDSTMCRYAEHVGATFGCIVDAMWREAKATAFCISTDATGCAIQPVRLEEKPRQRQPCTRGHFFVALADNDHVLFEFRERHTSDAVCEMFRGFNGYIQADAHCIYDALFRGEAVEEGEKPPDEVACWSHARRKAWEAAIMTKAPEAREALLRIRELFKREEEWKELAPKQRYERRQRVSRPMLDEFFAWAEGVFERVGSVRGPLASAFGYVIRQRDALRRYLDDGRLRIDNNAAERALRSPIAVGRKAWLFFGSNDHASAAANVFSLIASCVLHKLDVESYFTDIIRVLPYWPRDRYLELAPKYWARTRARLDAKELKLAVGHVTVPPPLPAEQQPSPN
jgi:transposase